MSKLRDVLEHSDFNLDKENMLQDLENISSHIERAINIGEKYSATVLTSVHNLAPFKNLKNIVFLGMGGSAIGGDVMSGYLSDEISIPIAVIRGYTAPKYISKNSLVFAVSYSGNTEETLSTLKQSFKAGANIIILSSGGKFQTFARNNHLPFIPLPTGIQPRVALPYLFFPLLKVMENIELINKKDSEIKEMLEIMQNISVKYSAKCPFESNLAKRIAFSLYKHIPLIYSTEGILSAVANRWKTQINENSKWPCFWNTFAELDHNEIVGYEIDNAINKMAKIVYLEDENGPLRMKQRAKITKKIINKKVAEFITCFSLGEKKLGRIFSMIYLGDMISYYLAILNGVDPSPVYSIEKLKKELAKQQKFS